MSEPKIVSTHKMFGGTLKFVEHWSECNQCTMTFSIYQPDEAKSFPVLYHLGGAGSSCESVTKQHGYQQAAKQNNLVVVVPDTSPRNVDYPEIEEAD